MTDETINEHSLPMQHQISNKDGGTVELININDIPEFEYNVDATLDSIADLFRFLY